MKVSIIVPVYNVENYLKKCLDSLINQTLKDIEIICINDGSTDKSLEILQDYAQKDNRIKVLNQTNSGVSKTRNKGIELAQGEYLGFCDSDDWVDLDFYEKLYTHAKQNNADIAVTNIVKVKKNKYKKFFSINKTNISENYYEKLKLCNTPDFSYIYNKIYKTAELKKCNLQFGDYVVYEDSVFSTQILFHLKKLITISDTNYYYLYRENSLIHSKDNDTDFNNTTRVISEFLEKHNIPSNEVMTTIKAYNILKLIKIKLKTKNNKTQIKVFKGW